MKTFPLVTLIVSVAAASSIATTIAQQHVQKSTVYGWSTDGVKANDWGAVRQVMRAPTPTLDELEIHISTLDPGKSPHAPHQHQHEELLILKRARSRPSRAARRAASGRAASSSRPRTSCTTSRMSAGRRPPIT